jgi:membrane protease YdiL (CAAX protease family)
VIRFVVLAFGITWILLLPLVLSAQGVLPPLPTWLHGLGALGPILAAYFAPRDHGVFEARGPSRLSGGVTVLCLTSPAMFAAIALLVAGSRGEPIAAPLSGAVRDPDWLISLLVGSLLYGFGEEPGWRGWLQPKLQERHSAFVATLLLTPIWAVWHLPFFFYRFDFEGPVTIVGFFIGLLAGAFWLAFLFNATRSVVVVAVWHVLWNVANIALAAVSSTAVGVLNALMMVLGFGVAVLLARQARTEAG